LSNSFIHSFLSSSNQPKQVKLEEVEVKSGEEEEESLISLRSKLFIFGETLLDKGTGKKSWRERGIGDAKILRHKQHSRLRILMRQEKTMKVIVNHALDPRIKLEPNAGSDRSWVWSAFDFSGGELVETVFALRFADSEIADSFKEKFEEGQREMESLLAGEDKLGEDGGEAVDEAAKALGALKTGDEGAAEAEVAVAVEAEAEAAKEE
jgi:Ran-binding protein 1